MVSPLLPSTIIVAIASVPVPASITAVSAPAIIDGNENAGRDEEQGGDDENDQTDETCGVESHGSSPGETRQCFSSSFARERKPAYWTFAAGPRSNRKSRRRRLVW